MSRFLVVCLALPLLINVMPAAEPRIDLWPAGVSGGPPASSPEKIITDDGWTRVTNVQVPGFTVHRPPEGRATGASIVVVPGGGYGIVAFEHEGTDVASWLNERGITAFVLRYRHSPDQHPKPLQDVLRAIRIVRFRATEFGVKPDRIGVLGFSAGGHLASCAATMFESTEGRGADALDAVSARPDFAVLIYPVITLEGPAAHVGSRENLLGRDARPQQIEYMSTHNRVTSDTPPLFLLHAADDDAVPVENIHLMHAAAQKAGVPAELRIFAHGGHGFGMRPNSGEVTIWPELVLGWMREQKWVP